ncbi:E3 ubiquitin-protein ligase MPSR1 [Ziziphus jujuba]|uniref:RING-type E3 ubiquitin transferase n=2 Tax=Ziziphus jujuba TaxID=326968 RepID=A0ABM3IKK2_ZIZJJ|nr:E3 ubiquitin-protein ligase MPSR1 [Ziziphus jujuba]KAH7529117.1 hypothetical protein FEM48_Zijuj05G0150300 [Ziziphus jujuba var. spinosa]
MAGGDYYFGAWPLDHIETEDESLASAKFMFLIQASYNQEDDDLILHQHECVEYDVVMHDDERSKVAIHHILSNIGVPVLPSMVQRVLDVAHSMSSNRHFAGRKVLRILVDVRVLSDDDDDYDDDDDVVELELGGEDDWEPKFEPASKVSIEELERIKVEGSLKEEVGCCSVCFDDFENGCEATRMPCLHLFHGDCIVKWLQTSKLCPLCRFQMPSL